MHVSELHVSQLRNLADTRITPHVGLNAFLGDNGAGKTNLLEAVHLATALRPLKPFSRTRELIHFDHDIARVNATLDIDGPLPVVVEIHPSGRKATLAGKSVRELSQLAKRIGVVSFTPTDLELVRGSPDRRRRGLDRFAFQLDSAFGAVAKRYEEALGRRNKLLKEYRPDPALLEAYNEPLVDAAAHLIRARVRALKILQPAFISSTAAVTDQRLHSNLRYKSQLKEWDDTYALAETDPAEIARALMERLLASSEGEKVRKTTLVGPHLDDVLISQDERASRNLASQGEARALVLALKLAEVHAYRDEKKVAPVFLLDDVAGELDPHKARCLFETTERTGAQTFVTATHRALLLDAPIGAVFELIDGVVQTSTADSS